MKINYFKIDNWYILQDFEITLDKDLAILIGENGSGKSSLLEAIALIFGHLRKYFIEGDKKASFIAGYVISFDSTVVRNNKNYKYEVEIQSIDYQDDIDDSGVFNYRLKIDREEFDLKQANIKLKEIGGFAQLLPDEIVLYYSGNTNRLFELSYYFEKKYRKQITKIDNQYTLKPLSFPKDIPFLYSSPDLLSMILLSLLISSKESHQKFVSEYVGDVDLANVTISINLKKPSWAHSGSNLFWGASESIIKEFLLHLDTYSDDKIYEKNKITFTFHSVFPLIDLTKFIISVNEEQFLFKMLRLLHYNELLGDIFIDWGNALENSNIELDRISEGQKQILSTIGLISLMEENNCLILLDEPDTFLHPKWQINFIKQINRSLSNQIILTTHSLNMLNHIDSNVSDLLLFSKGKIDLTVPKDNFGKTIAYINYNLMGIEERPRNIQDKIDELFKYLEEEDIDKASDSYSYLLSIIGENDDDMRNAKIELDFLKTIN